MRLEIQAALELNIPVVPVCIGDALVPGEESLPSEIGGLSYKQAAEISAGQDLGIHLKRLVDGLEHLLADLKTEEESKNEEIVDKATRRKIADLKSKVDEEQHNKEKAVSKNLTKEKEQRQNEEKKRQNDEERNLKVKKKWYAEPVEKKWFKRIVNIHLSEETHVLEINGRKFGLKIRYGVDGESPLKKCSWPTEILVTDGSINRKISFTVRFPSDINIAVDHKVLYRELPK